HIDAGGGGKGGVVLRSGGVGHGGVAGWLTARTRLQVQRSGTDPLTEWSSVFPSAVLTASGSKALGTDRVPVSARRLGFAQTSCRQRTRGRSPVQYKSSSAVANGLLRAT